MKNTSDKQTHQTKKKRPVITPSGQIVHLTPGQKNYADSKLAHPLAPLKDAAREAYPNASEETLKQVVKFNEKNIDITIYTEAQISKASQTVVEIMNSKKAKPDTRLKAADSLLDRAYGKATTRTEVHSTNLNLNIEASAELNTKFADFLKLDTQQ